MMLKVRTTPGCSAMARLFGRPSWRKALGWIATCSSASQALIARSSRSSAPSVTSRLAEKGERSCISVRAPGHT